MVHKFPFETQYYLETSHPQLEKKISPHVRQAVRNYITYVGNTNIPIMLKSLL